MTSLDGRIYFQTLALPSRVGQLASYAPGETEVTQFPTLLRGDPTNPELVAYDGALFAAHSAVNSFGVSQPLTLHRIDPDSETIVPLFPNSASPTFPRDLIVVGATLYFTAETADGSREVFAYRPSAGEPVQVTEVSPSGTSRLGGEFVDADGALALTIDDPFWGEEVFTLNGSAFVASAPTAEPVERGFRLDAWPNPARDRFIVQVLGAAQHATIAVYLGDALGRRVAQVHDGPLTSMHRLDVSTRELSAGLYFVVVRCGGATRLQSITVVR